MARQTRNHLEILAEIDSILKSTKRESERLLLEKEIRSSSTGSEICLRVGSILLSLKNEGPIDVAIGKQIDGFVEYCNSNGLFPQPGKLKK